MPAKPSIEKTRITLRMPLVIRAKMRKVMRDSEGVLNENDIALQALANSLKNIVPDKEDKAWMEQERRKNERLRGDGEK